MCKEALSAARLEGRYAVLPVGSLEWHCGGPLGADSVIAEAVARMLCEALSARGCEALLLPTLYYGASGEWGGHGYVGVSRKALLEFLSSLLASIAEHFDNVIVVNGHGGNSAVIRAAIEAVVYDGLASRPPRVYLVEWWRLIGHSLGHMDRVEALLLAALTGREEPVCECRGFTQPTWHVECRVAGRVGPGEEAGGLLERLRGAVEGYAASLCSAAP